MKNKPAPRKLSPLDEIFSHDKLNQTMLKISQLVPFPSHPFRLYTGKKLADMVESIRENGVMIPIIVRPKGGGVYEILSGHNRVNAAKIAGIEEVPAIIKENLSEAEAHIVVTDTNFMQRSVSDMLPSELAKSLKMQLDACKEAKQKQELLRALESASNPHDDRGYEQGALIEHPCKSVEKIADNNKMSRANIQRYIRLNYLIEVLLNEVDEDNIGLYPAVSLSYLKEEEQHTVLEIMKSDGYKIDMVKAVTLRSYSEACSLTAERIYTVLSGKRKSNKPAQIKISSKVISRFFTQNQTPAEIAATVEKALELYFSSLPKADLG